MFCRAPAASGVIRLRRTADAAECLKHEGIAFLSQRPHIQNSSASRPQIGTVGMIEEPSLCTLSHRNGRGKSARGRGRIAGLHCASTRATGVSPCLGLRTDQMTLRRPCLTSSGADFPHSPIVGPRFETGKRPGPLSMANDSRSNRKKQISYNT
jgi:hypothetical protein